jgi:hypothetical protein
VDEQFWYFSDDKRVSARLVDDRAVDSMFIVSELHAEMKAHTGGDWQAFTLTINEQRYNQVRISGRKSLTLILCRLVFNRATIARHGHPLRSHSAGVVNNLRSRALKGSEPTTLLLQAYLSQISP